MTTTQQPQADFVKALSRLDATALVVGSMIGSGIFIVSAEMLREDHTPGLLHVVRAKTHIVTNMQEIKYRDLNAYLHQEREPYEHLRQSYPPVCSYVNH